jgi:hypothetical protein
MRRHVALVSIVVLLTGVFAAFGAAPALALPARTTYGPPAVQTHLVLAETSIDGPSVAYYVPGRPQDGTADSVIAWTGTDAAHHLNVMKSADGIHYDAKTKLILPELSSFRPSVTRQSDPAGGLVSVAWVGVDANHSLNVMFDVYGQRMKLTLWSDNSFAAPALFGDGGSLLLAWAGTDAGHSLNVLPISVTAHGLVAGTKTTLWQFQSATRPTLSHVANSSAYLMSWCNLAANRVYFATSTDGVTWKAPLAAPLAEWSYAAPSMIGLNTTNMPLTWLAWTGIDPAHSVNVQYTETYPNWPADGSKSVLGEQALGGPALAYLGVNRQVVIAWTGTDAQHHLNVATVNV